MASQGEQIGGDPGEPDDLHPTPLQGFPVLRGGPLALERQIEVAPQGGQRSPEFMACVGRESALDRGRLVQPVKHPIEHPHQPGELVDIGVRGDRGTGRPLPNGLRLRGDVGRRPERGSGDAPPDQERRACGQQHEQDAQQDEIPQRALQRSERCCHLQHVHPMGRAHQPQRIDYAAQSFPAPLVGVPYDLTIAGRRDRFRRQHEVGGQVATADERRPVAAPQLSVAGELGARPGAGGEEYPLVKLELGPGVGRTGLCFHLGEMHQGVVKLSIEQRSQRQRADHSHQQHQRQHTPGGPERQREAK